MYGLRWVQPNNQHADKGTTSRLVALEIWSLNGTCAVLWKGSRLWFLVARPPHARVPYSACVVRTSGWAGGRTGTGTGKEEDVSDILAVICDGKKSSWRNKEE